MSDNNQDKPDEYEAIFSDTPLGASRKEPSFEEAEVEYTDVSDLSGDVRDIDDGEGGVDDPDSEDGIFAPEPQQEKKAKSSSGLLGAVALLAVAGAGGYVYFTNPQLIDQVKQNFMGGGDVVAEAPVTPDVPVAAMSAQEQPVAANPASATPEMPVNPVIAELPVDVASGVVAQVVNPVSAEVPVTEVPAADVVATEAPVQVASAGGVITAPTPDLKADVAPENVDVKVGSGAAPEVVSVPVSEEAVVAVNDQPPVGEPPVAQVVNAESSSVSVPAPVSDMKETSAKKEDVKAAPKAADKTADENVVVVDSKDAKKNSADAKLDAYFDSPSGKILKDIPAPSMNPKKGVNESIIVVEQGAKKSVKSSAKKPVKAAPVSIEMNDLDTKVVAANRAVMLERYDAAKEMYDELYKLNPRDGRILMGRAVLFQKTGDNDRAISAYEEVLAQNPDNTEAVINLAGLVRKQYPAVALSKLLDLSQKYPNSAVVAGQLGVAYADSGNFKDAYFNLSKAAALDPNNAQHYYNMAVVAERAGNVQIAIQNYEKSLEVDAIYGEGSHVISRERIYDRLARLRGN